MTATHIFRVKGDVGSLLRLGTMAAGLLTLAACASTPQPPNVALQAAELSIANAEQARVAGYQSPELGKARVKLAAARAAVRQKKMALAQSLAEQSRVHAELASARADLFKVKAANDEMLKNTDTLKQEMRRNPRSQPS
ncbi:MAG: DUF4398 domain-containing protein [Immundisolibacter sp.]|uniref:DUF4398 domain-containing protein n=1 Tax=Immundisolibacter sp. TaxID=1934948 RepID=UPI003EE22342